MVYWSIWRYRDDKFLLPFLAMPHCRTSWTSFVLDFHPHRNSSMHNPFTIPEDVGLTYSSVQNHLTIYNDSSQKSKIRFDKQIIINLVCGKGVSTVNSARSKLTCPWNLLGVYHHLPSDCPILIMVPLYSYSVIMITFWLFSLWYNRTCRIPPDTHTMRQLYRRDPALHHHLQWYCWSIFLQLCNGLMKQFFSHSCLCF